MNCCGGHNHGNNHNSNNEHQKNNGNGNNSPGLRMAVIFGLIVLAGLALYFIR